MNRDKIKSFIDWVADNFSGIANLIFIVLTLLLTVVLELKPSIPLISFEQYKWYFTILISLLFISIAVISFIKDSNRFKKVKLLEKEILDLKNDNIKISNEKSNLENEIESLLIDTKEIFDSYLGFMSKSLQLDHNHRVSVYKHSIDKFMIIGRYSDNPKFKKINRNQYPENEGFISIAWEKGEFMVDDLPDPQKESEKYLEQIKSMCDISDEVLSRIKMKSQSFYIKTLYGHDSMQPKAVLVIEGIGQKSLNIENIKIYLKTAPSFVGFIEKLKVKINNSNIASEQGF